MCCLPFALTLTLHSVLQEEEEEQQRRQRQQQQQHQPQQQFSSSAGGFTIDGISQLQGHGGVLVPPSSSGAGGVSAGGSGNPGSVVATAGLPQGSLLPDHAFQHTFAQQGYDFSSGLDYGLHFGDSGATPQGGSAGQGDGMGAGLSPQGQRYGHGSAE
jgi:hypothetical protein